MGNLEAGLITMRKLSALVFAVLSATSFSQYAGSKPVSEEFKKGFDAISIADAKEWLGYLAGPECAGRGTIQPGFQKAAAFMAERFKSMGLKPMGDNGTYFQTVMFAQGVVKDGTMIQVGNFKLPVGEDHLKITQMIDNATLVKKLAFIQGPAQMDLGDLAQLNDRVVFANAPLDQAQRQSLYKAGAAMVISVDDIITSRRNYSISGEKPVNAGRIHPNDFAKVLEEINMNPSFTGVKLSDKTITVTLDADITKTPSMNVVAILEGSDPVLKHEYVGVGGHLDHLGVVNRNGQSVVYPGADDDGSGSTAVLCVAKAITTNPLKPKRSIIFMAFCGEEMGLIGSRYITNNPPVDLTKMICELQMDMVGRDADGDQEGRGIQKASENVDTIRLIGSQRIATGLHKLILEQNAFVNLQFRYDGEPLYNRSDHYNFAAKGIPIAFLFDGIHPDYHQPTDTVDKINWDKLTNCARLFYLTALTAANRDAPFEHDVPQGNN